MSQIQAQGISVIMPTFNQANFISRAIVSLQAQRFTNWELLIINDGSTDDTLSKIDIFLSDKRISVFENKQNQGLGYCLNMGLAYAKYEYISYLPSDDVYYADHLSSLFEILQRDNAVLAFTGVRHHYNRCSTGVIENYSLQLVQVLHKKVNEKWVERKELVTDNLDRMYWSKLRKHGEFVGTANVTCEWVDHPDQLHKIIREPMGGINPYKLRYHVKHPLRFHSTIGNFIDEVSYYEPFRNREFNTGSEGSLKILLVGELAYNAERIVAFEERGHQLYGLWMKGPHWYNFVGPLPFGNVIDIPHDNWEQTLREIKPDVIYALLNWQAVPWAHEVMMKTQGIPFVWHFKEGPFICLEKGMWREMVNLHSYADGQIYSSHEMQVWFEQFLQIKNKNSFVLDGDLPKREWFTVDTLPLLSEQEGEIHTVVPGRPIGLHPYTVEELGNYKIHLHFYGDFTHGQWKEWIQKTLRMAPGFLHIHANCTQDRWAKEFSQYDAGWLHFFESENNGEIMRANWDDLNYPARMATLAVAGIPMLQRDNTGHLVATQEIVRKYELGIFFKDIPDLSNQLNNREELLRIRENVFRNRMIFCFDSHVDELVQFFKKVIQSSSGAHVKNYQEKSDSALMLDLSTEN